MKKALIGMAAGAMALGASVVPVSAGYLKDNNLWDVVQDETCNLDEFEGTGRIFEQLVLTSGWATRLDTDGNGDPRYTVFQPIEEILEAVLDSMGLEVSDLNSQPAAVNAILADHIANGSFSPDELKDKDLTRITMRSGYVATVYSTLDNAGGAVVRTLNTTYIGGAQFLYGNQASNGWRYCIGGLIDSTPQVPHEGLNSQDTPQDGTPGGTNTLPDTL
jgi:hypothetical protein